MKRKAKLVVIYLFLLSPSYVIVNCGGNGGDISKDILPSDTSMTEDISRDTGLKDYVIYDTEIQKDTEFFDCCKGDTPSFDVEDIMFDVISDITKADMIEDIKSEDMIDITLDIGADVIGDISKDVCIPDCNGKECGSDGCGGTCGKCGQSSACSNFKCECKKGFADCNLDKADGCEIDLSTDNKNCGECGKNCGEKEVCESYQCIQDTRPFYGFSIYRNVCPAENSGNHLWAKWLNKGNFELHGYRVVRPDGSEFKRTYYEIPEFLLGYEDVWLLDEDGPVPAGNYTISMFVKEKGIPVMSTITFKDIPVSDVFYRGKQILTLDEIRKGDYDEVVIRVKPTFEGSIYRVITYQNGCWSTTKLFYSPPVLYPGYSTDVEIGNIFCNTGDSLLIVVEGMNDDIKYSFYTVLEGLCP
ncbi:MAG: hypothetical protein N2746_11805 [Deltaproteobacteria bacterium]|nr:hypothetical protein [Deltaproteobacteria bacterium]